MDLQQQSHQSDEQLHVVVTSEGVVWRICSGGTCLTDASGLRLMERYAALLVSQGRRVPPG